MNQFGFDEVTSSAGDVQQDAVGILLTKGGMMDGTDSATARHEDEAKRNTNGTADVIDRKGFAETYTVEECCEILDSQRVPIKGSERSAGEYPYYGANGIQDYVDDYIFDDELVLLAEDGGNFGSKIRPIAYRVSGKCWVNNHAHVLKPKSMIDVDYLCYYIRQHQDNVAIAKLKTNQPLTETDIETLEEILWKEVGTKQDYEHEIGTKPLGEFVREIVGLDMNAAKEAFSEYLTSTSLDSRQIYFVNQIVEYIVHNGMMKDLSVLQESPFTDQGSVVEIFTDLTVWMGIRKVIESINANAAA